jgi:hypothetical protein
MIDPHRDDQTNDPKRPSQAEGDRATVEQSLSEQSAKRRSGVQGGATSNDRTNDPERPSQAEGERDAAEEADKQS